MNDELQIRAQRKADAEGKRQYVVVDALGQTEVTRISFPSDRVLAVVEPTIAFELDIDGYTLIQTRLDAAHAADLRALLERCYVNAPSALTPGTSYHFVRVRYRLPDGGEHEIGAHLPLTTAAVISNFVEPLMLTGQP